MECSRQKNTYKDALLLRLSSLIQYSSSQQSKQSDYSNINKKALS